MRHALLILITRLVLVVGLSAPPAMAEPADAGLNTTAKRPKRTRDQVKLLYFTATWCGGCKRFEASGILERLPKGVVLERVDIDEHRDQLDRYGVEVTPTLLLVDADGFRLGKVKIDLDDASVTAERAEKLVAKMTKP